MESSVIYEKCKLCSIHFSRQFQPWVVRAVHSTGLNIISMDKVVKDMKGFKIENPVDTNDKALGALALRIMLAQQMWILIQYQSQM